MSVSHIQDLENHLAQRGWRIVAVHPGDGNRISATWEIQRSTKNASLMIDFDGLEPMGRFCLPLEESYGCGVRGNTGASLYFRKRVSSRRELWIADLTVFVDALDAVPTGMD